MALDELSNILDKVPKQTHVAGDFNIDLHGSNSKNIQDYENAIFSEGFFLTMSTVTHEKPGCKPSCIDNFITNNIESVLCLEQFRIPYQTIFKFFECSVNKSNCNAKHTQLQYHDYCNSNAENFTTLIQEEMNDNMINDFGTFLNIFNDSLNKACKLEVPRTSKRTIQNNPWITSGIIVAISQCDKLYNAWVKYRKKKCKDETDNRGGTCLCNICNDKHKHNTAYKEYRKTLKRVRKDARSKLYTGKFNEKSGDMKKTWELINSIRGKGKRQIKAQFIIDNEKITNRRVIANEFNKYFVSLATNLNEAYNEIGELTVNSIPSFADYLQKTN